MHAKNIEKSSIVIIGYQKRDEKIYPNTEDLILSLENYFDEIIYIEAEGFRTYGNLGDIDRSINNMKRSKGFYDLFVNTQITIEKITEFKTAQDLLRKKLKNIKLRNERYVIIAIDELIFYLSKKVFEKNVILLSYDFLSTDTELFLIKGFCYKLNQYLRKEITSSLELMIQDEKRKQVFELMLGNKQFCKTLYIPVGLLDNEFCKKESKNRKIGKMVKIIQSGGHIGEERRSCELIESYQTWPVQYELHLKGCIMYEIYEQIDNVERKPHLYPDIVASYKIPEILNNFDIGFVGYTEIDLNFKYLENASGQFVEYLRLGIPVIVYGSDSIVDFVNNSKVGIGIKSMKDMVPAIGHIMENYSEFSKNARKLFDRKYNLKNQCEEYLVKFIKTIIGDEKSNSNLKSKKENNSCNVLQIEEKRNGTSVKTKNRILSLLATELTILLLNPLKSNRNITLINLINKFFTKTKHKICLKKVKKVAIFGTLQNAERYFELLLEKNIEVVCFLDNSASKHGESLKGKKIYPVDFIVHEGNKLIDGVVLTSKNRKHEMRKQLKNLGFKKTIIEL